MALSDYSRYALIESFDDIRPSFLAALDQVVAEMRPKLQAMPGFTSDSIRSCALAFANPELVRAQMIDIQPDLLDRVDTEELADAHLAAISYLLSLTLHELMHTREETTP